MFTMWPQQGRDVTKATAEAQDSGYYKVTFVDSKGDSMAVVRLSRDALDELVETGEDLLDAGG